jgi:hypothetical protein
MMFAPRLLGQARTRNAHVHDAALYHVEESR